MRAWLLILLFCSTGFETCRAAPSDDRYAEAIAYLNGGQYALAVKALKAAVRTATTVEQRALAMGALGLIHYRLNHAVEAEAMLRQALDSGSGDAHAKARWKAALARLAASHGQAGRASQLFTEALQFAGDDQLLRSGIELGRAERLPEPERLPALQAIRLRLQALPSTPERDGYLVNLAVQARRLGQAGSELAYAALSAAEKSGGQDHRFKAEVQGELAQLYEDAQRTGEALMLNRQAITTAPADAHDLLLELEWRQARLQRASDRIPEALAAYQHAVDHVEAIRDDIPLEYRDGRSSFRDTLEPLYLQYADLLLRQTPRQAPAERQLTLRRARQSVERIKQSEFEDFLGGRCAVHPVANIGVDGVETGTAVLYPVILQDRLELLISIGGTMQQFTSLVDGPSVRDHARNFAAALRSAQPEAKNLGQSLYRWLIEPVEPWLREHKVQTLVMVPDGVLRLVPLAALYDGKHFLVERYALSTSPGLSLIAPSPLQPRQAATLLAGMDEPGDVIDRLPAEFLETLDVNAARGLQGSKATRDRTLRLAAARGAILPNAPRPEPGLRDAAFRQALKEALRLPGVREELTNLHAATAGTLLLDKDFTAARFKRELLGAPYSIVHIASHGIMGSTAATSFILAYDAVIGFDQLETLLRSEKFARQPVDLLTLSACQTAEGDDRAPLGFSGLALKTRVRSAVGTLWPVNDEAASTLMTAFYKALIQPGTSRAKALQQAQRALLQDARLEHPFFWAPFILVGNWL